LGDAANSPLANKAISSSDIDYFNEIVGLSGELWSKSHASRQVLPYHITCSSSGSHPVVFLRGHACISITPPRISMFHRDLSPSVLTSIAFRSAQDEKAWHQRWHDAFLIFVTKYLSERLPPSLVYNGLRASQYAVLGQLLAPINPLTTINVDQGFLLSLVLTG